MTKIVTFSNIPSELEGDWLQHLRDFDAAHEGCFFEVFADSPHTIDEITEIFRGTGFGHVLQFKKQS